MTLLLDLSLWKSLCLSVCLSEPQDIIEINKKIQFNVIIIILIISIHFVIFLKV